MMFAAFTSAYLVKMSDGNWPESELPAIMWVNTLVLLISSGTMHWSLVSARKDNMAQLRTGLWLTFGLGIAFLIGQYISWTDLVAGGVFFVGNAAGSFIYVLTGMHGVHLISGLVLLIFVLVAAYRFRIHSRKMTTMEMCTTYWHFLGGLWLYLFIFLLLNH
jgi:cytochrome c oxidase subunit 3